MTERVTHTSRIIDCALAGMPPKDITQSTGIPISSVYAIISAARRRGVPIPVFDRSRRYQTPPLELHFAIDDQIAEALQAEANARGLRATALARKVIEAVAQDSLWNAVLEE